MRFLYRISLTVDLASNMKYLFSILLLAGFSLQVQAQNEERKEQLIKDLKKELRILSDQITELGNLMAEELEAEFRKDSVKIKMDRAKKSIKESQQKIREYSKELNDNYQLDDEQKELLRSAAKNFGEGMRQFGEAMSRILDDINEKIEEHQKEMENEKDD